MSARIARVAGIVLALSAVTLLAAPAASAHHGKIGAPKFPKIGWPCSASQAAYLKDAWWEAYRYTRSAEHLVKYIASRPSADRRGLWEQDFRGFGGPDDWRKTPSPQRWFGAYDSERLALIKGAFVTATDRFQGETIYLLTCDNACTTAGAHHIVRGRIVTCRSFWTRARDSAVSLSDRIARSARTLTHEVFHHITMKVDGVARFIEDFHTDGVGPHPNRKYYGIENVTYLARNVPRWAMRNNDTYSYFAQAVKRVSPPRLTGVFAEKEGGGRAGMFYDMTQTQLFERKAQQAALGQYLDDVETYVRHGKRLFAALWRVGRGDGPMLFADRETFLRSYHGARTNHDLIDIEVYRENGKLMYLGVFRTRAPDAIGFGGLKLGQTWGTLVANWNAFAPDAYLTDVEVYSVDGKNRYIGVWLAGSGAGALMATPDLGAFRKTLENRKTTQQLIDVERFEGDDGRTWWLGSWRHADRGLNFFRESFTELVARWRDLATCCTLIDIEEDSTLPLQAGP